MKRGRRFCFTSHKIEELYDFSCYENVTYAIYQLELSPTTNKEHYQGYIEVNNPCTNIDISERYLDGVAHVEYCNGDQESNIKYCSKEETRLDGPWVYGIPKHQGKRMDLNKVVNFIKEKKTIKQIAEECPLETLKYSKHINELKKIYQEDRTELTKCIWIYGPTGCGKTKYIKEKYPNSYWKSNGYKWWDGYEQQDTIIIDDADSTEYPIMFWLHAINHNPWMPETKGSHVKFNSKLIVVTSNEDPTKMYLSTDSHYEAFLRRIEIINYENMNL